MPVLTRRFDQTIINLMNRQTKDKKDHAMTLRPRPDGSLPVIVLGLALLSGPCASAHPLFRVHVRPSAYRVAPPRLPQVRLPAVVQQSAGLGAQAAALAPTAALARAVITQAPARALLGRH